MMMDILDFPDIPDAPIQFQVKKKTSGCTNDRWNQQTRKKSSSANAIMCAKKRESSRSMALWSMEGVTNCATDESTDRLKSYPFISNPPLCVSDMHSSTIKCNESTSNPPLCGPAVSLSGIKCNEGTSNPPLCVSDVSISTIKCNEGTSNPPLCGSIAHLSTIKSTVTNSNKDDSKRYRQDNRIINRVHHVDVKVVIERSILVPSPLYERCSYKYPKISFHKDHKKSSIRRKKSKRDHSYMNICENRKVARRLCVRRQDRRQLCNKVKWVVDKNEQCSTLSRTKLINKSIGLVTSKLQNLNRRRFSFLEDIELHDPSIKKKKCEEKKINKSVGLVTSKLHNLDRRRFSFLEDIELHDPSTKKKKCEEKKNMKQFCIEELYKLKWQRILAM